MLRQCGHFSALAPRFNGRNCGFPASTQAQSKLEGLEAPATLDGDDDQQTHFESDKVV